MSVFDSFLEIAGNLGFLVGDNDRRRERARKEKRSWGTEQEGLAVSIAASSVDLKPDETLRIEVALRNSGTAEREFMVGNWLRFFKLDISGPSGFPVELTTFGRRQLEAAQNAPELPMILKPDEVMEADFPVSVLYQLKDHGEYTVVGRSIANSAVSNELKIRI